MIKSFKNKETEKIFGRAYVKKLPKNIQDRAYRKLVMLDSAVKLKDLRVPPGNQLKKLKGKQEKKYSIRINDQWRLCFIWKAGDAYDVEITDYH